MADPKVFGLRVEIICNGEVDPSVLDKLNKDSEGLVKLLGDLNGYLVYEGKEGFKMMDQTVRKTDRELVCSNNETLFSREFRIRGETPKTRIFLGNPFSN